MVAKDSARIVTVFHMLLQRFGFLERALDGFAVYRLGFRSVLAFLDRRQSLASSRWLWAWVAATMTSEAAVPFVLDAAAARCAFSAIASER